ncbi:MAG: DNA replication/repair protein RecF [Aaplasma endosymbiont of Hyalomma asiaticum]
MSCEFQSYIQSLKLVHFRNYLKAELESDGKSVILLGENGVGKTNILEAVSLLSKGPGMRNVNTDCMQNNISSVPWLVSYKIVRNDDRLSVDITRKNNRRQISIDGKDGLYGSLHKILRIVWLMPQLDHILLKAPTERLRFFDRIVNIFDENYLLNMVKYEKAKRDRKRILHECPQNHKWLSSLETVMSNSGVRIAIIRHRVLETLHSTLSQNENASAFFKFLISFESEVFNLLGNDIETTIQKYSELLHNNRSIDSCRQCTTFGVHKDNFQILHEGKSLAASSCSTGEQKVLLLSLLLTAATAKHRIDGQAPIMLLDDVMSHLDFKHREELIEILKRLNCQAWMTDVDTKNFKQFQDHFQCFRIAENSIQKV